MKFIIETVEPKPKDFSGENLSTREKKRGGEGLSTWGFRLLRKAIPNSSNPRTRRRIDTPKGGLPPIFSTFRYPILTADIPITQYATV